ncbi:MAG: c-type cytochrome [Vicinamibacteria bacterium]
MLGIRIWKGWVKTVLVLLFLFLQTNPQTSADDVGSGKRVYRVHCASCHGIDGRGGRGPDLTSGDFYHGATDADLYRNIEDGIPGTEMPANWLVPKRLWQVVAFVRSLSETESASSTRGDASRGQELFRGKGGCLECHRVGREGGFAGPDLSTVGSRRSPEHLKASLLAPEEEINRDYWIATVSPSNGGVETTGYVRNEDRHYLLLLDLEGKLRTFEKSGLQQIEKDRRSMMQSYDGVFDDSGLEDLVAYLASLRKARAQ